jgi:hypothetical protein
MLALLSPREESALRKVGFGGAHALELPHARRLLGLELIEPEGSSFRLTIIGRRRSESLVPV